MNYCDKAKICRLGDELPVVQGIFEHWEYNLSVNVTCKAIMFFVFIFEGSTRAAYEYEHIVFFDKSFSITRFQSNLLTMMKLCTKMEK